MITGATSSVVTVASNAFNPRNPGVAIAGSLFGVSVQFDDGVIEIDAHRAVNPGQHTGVCWASTVNNRLATASSWRT